MIATTRRRGIAALAVAGIALTGAFAVPAAHATNNDSGDYKTKEQRCEEIGGWFDKDVQDAGAADQAGDAAGREAALSQARLDLTLARGAGCDWAGRAVIPTFGRRAALPTGGATVFHP